MSKLGLVIVLAFLVGPAIPICFPIAFVFFSLLEIGTRYRLAYNLKLPFNIGNEMNKMFLKLCPLFPVFYSSFGFWMYSNRQIFDNNVVPKSRTNGIIEHNHTVVYSLTTLTPGTPLLILFVISIINLVFINFDIKYSSIFSFCKNPFIEKLREPDMDEFY